MDPSRKIWITWESQRRTIELARRLPDVRLFILQINAPRFVRYPYLILKTLQLLFLYRPKLLFVQNPSVVLTLSAVLLMGVLRFHLVVDAHNEGVKPFHSHHNWLLPIYSWIQKKTDLTIVTNDQLAKEVASNGGNPFVMEDPIPQMGATGVISLQGKHNIVFVCTFEKDEPYKEVIASARFVDRSTCIYITGNYRKAPLYIVKETPADIVFTGFLPEQAYVNLLHSSDAVMDLTLMQDCLVCGAYEAVALGRPLILSDTQALRSYFYKGTVYTENSSQAIAKSIGHAISNQSQLELEMCELKKELEAAWQAKFNEFKSILGRLQSL
jgi:glycosyltransferase involved in cell wall biosynthesis